MCPHRLTFVLKQTQDGETWFNNGGSNYAVQLRAPPIDSFVKKVRRDVTSPLVCRLVRQFGR